MKTTMKVLLITFYMRRVSVKQLHIYLGSDIVKVVSLEDVNILIDLINEREKYNKHDIKHAELWIAIMSQVEYILTNIMEVELK